MKTQHFISDPHLAKVCSTTNNNTSVGCNLAVSDRQRSQTAQKPIVSSAVRQDEEGLAVEPSGSRPSKPSLHSASTTGGGQTTISPPVNVKTPPLPPNQILASGFDTLYFAINIFWENSQLFNELECLKKTAAFNDEPHPIELAKELDSNEWIFSVMPFGSQGYEWIINNKEYTLRIGNWIGPKTRPSVMLEIHSETLWSHGPEESINRIIDLLEYHGAFITEIKPSRADLCVDLMMDSANWIIDLIHYRVTRSKYAGPHIFNNILTGISIGKGHISARLYDKPLEIKTKKS